MFAGVSSDEGTEDEFEVKSEDAEELSVTTDSDTTNIQPELPSIEHIKLIRPDLQLVDEPTSEDIQQLLNDDEFSEKLLASDEIPDSVKQFFLLQRSPVIEAVVPRLQYSQSIGWSKAPNLMDILLGTVGSDYDAYSMMSTGQDTELDEEDDDDSLDKPSRRVKCIPKTLPTNETYTPVVKILSSSELLERLENKDDYSHNCAVVLFFAPWCTFCARVGPHFNALARAFPQIDVYAIDAAHFSK